MTCEPSCHDCNMARCMHIYSCQPACTIPRAWLAGSSLVHAAGSSVPAITYDSSSATHDVFVEPLVCLKGHRNVGQGSHLLGDEGSCRGLDV